MTNLVIEHVDPASLTPAPYNPRTMTEDARARLKRGIMEFGLVDPLIVRRADRLIVGGHQRHAVALDLGLATVPVVFLDDLDDNRAATLNVLLNNPAAQGVWDFPKLSEILSSLDSMGLDATLTGFDLAQLEQILVWDKPMPGAEESWKGMPDMEQGDTSAFRQILISFPDAESVARFATLLGLSLTARTRFTWFPPQEQDKVVNLSFKVQP